MQLSKLVTVVALLGVGGVAVAQGRPSVMTMQPYVGAGVGQSEYDVGGGSWGAGFGTDDDKDTAWRVFAGLRAHRFIGAEIGYFDLGEAKGRPTGSAEAQGIDLTALGIVPVFERGPHLVEVYGRLGGYWWDADVSNTGPGSNLDGGDGFDYTYGIGAQYHFANFGVRGEWQQYNDVFDRVDTDVWMGSVMYRF